MDQASLNFLTTPGDSTTCPSDWKRQFRFLFKTQISLQQRVRNSNRQNHFWIAITHLNLRRPSLAIRLNCVVAATGLSLNLKNVLDGKTRSSENWMDNNLQFFTECDLKGWLLFKEKK